MTGSPIFFSNLRNRRNTSNWNYGMSIKSCQAIQKSCLDRESNARFTLGSESESMVCDTWNFFGSTAVTVLKSLNDRQSDIFHKFKESKHHTQLKIWYVDYDMNIMSSEKSYAFQNIFLSPLFFFICMREYAVLQSGHDTLVVTSPLFPLKRDPYFWQEISSTRQLRSLLISAFIQCRSILSSRSIIRCSSYLPLFAFVYWISIHSFSEMKFPAKSKGHAWHKMSRRGCHDLTTILHTLSCKYSIKKHVLDRLILLSGHNVHIIINIW